MSQHEEEYLDDENWFEIAQKENIRLECNRCSNNFYVIFTTWYFNLMFLLHTIKKLIIPI